MKSAVPTICAVLCLLPAPGQAEEVGQSATTASTGQPPQSRFRDPQDGQLDLSNFLVQPRAFLPIPLIVTESAVGYGGGLAGMFVRPRKAEGSEGYARPNMSIVGGIATENGTWGAFAADSSYWFGDRLQTLAAAGVGQLNLDFYGLGDASDSLDQPVRYELDFSLALIQGNWKPKAKSPWSFGMRYFYSSVEPKLRGDVPPQFPSLIDKAHIDISAPAAVLEYDSRDNLFTPTRGLFAESLILVAREAFGASRTSSAFRMWSWGGCRWPRTGRWGCAATINGLPTTPRFSCAPTSSCAA